MREEVDAGEEVGGEVVDDVEGPGRGAGLEAEREVDETGAS